MHIDEISSFYGEDRGWLMFDAEKLTPEIKAYLEAEVVALGQVVHQGGYKRLVEVGCGWGRYLDWALSGGLSYVGLDIVPWLIKMAELRLTAARVKYQNPLCSVHLHEAEKLAELPFLKRSGQETLVWFPFNCFGNVSKIDQVIDSLLSLGLDCAISTFKTDAVSTKARREYYESCGYRNLSTRIVRSGLIFNSEEGFHANAYNRAFLSDYFVRRGFSLRSDLDLPVGYLMHFTLNNKPQPAVKPDLDLCSAVQATRRAVACFIANDSLFLSGHAPADLLGMKEVVGELTQLTFGRVSFLSACAISEGTVLRLHVSLPDSTLHADLVGHVLDSESFGDGRFEAIVQISGADKLLWETVFG